MSDPTLTMFSIALPFGKLEISDTLWELTSPGSEMRGELSEDSGSFPAVHPLLFAAFYISGKRYD